MSPRCGSGCTPHCCGPAPTSRRLGGGGTDLSLRRPNMSDRLPSRVADPLGHAVKLDGWLVLWGSLRHLTTVWSEVLDRGWRYSQDIVWEKQNGSGSHADRFRRVHEHAVLFYRGGWDRTYHDPQFSLD